MAKIRQDQDIVTELKIEFRNVIESISGIKTDVKELVKSNNEHLIAIKLAQQEIKQIKLNCDGECVKNEKMVERIGKLEQTQAWFYAKIGTFTTVVTMIVSWIVTNFYKRL